jgi:hypothetical protein
MSPIPSIHTEEFDLLLNGIAADDCVREDDFVSLPMSPEETTDCLFRRSAYDSDTHLL